MPSNKELIKDIAYISEELEKDAPETDGKNNGDLANILSALKAERKEADQDLTPGAAEEAKPCEKPPFYVAPGKAITSKRGILATERDSSIEAFAEIKAEDLAGGKEALDAFVKSGHVGKA